MVFPNINATRNIYLSAVDISNTNFQIEYQHNYAKNR